MDFQMQEELFNDLMKEEEEEEEEEEKQGN